MYYLKESWYMGDRWFEEWVEEYDPEDDPELAEWEYGLNTDQFLWIPPVIVEDDNVIWYID